MLPIISIVGHSNVGKTTFLERLIPELRSRGYRVGAVKHSHHGVDLDTPGTDSHRLAKAGADPVALASSGRLWVTHSLDQELSPQAIADLFFTDVDLMLTEGYKRGSHPKIEVWRHGVSDAPLCQDWELVARVGDVWPSSSAPHFNSDDVGGVAALIEERFLHQRKESLYISVNDKPVVAEGFARRVVVQTLMGLLSALKGYTPDPSKVVVQWRKGDSKG